MAKKKTTKKNTTKKSSTKKKATKKKLSKKKTAQKNTKKKAAKKATKKISKKVAKKAAKKTKKKASKKVGNKATKKAAKKATKKVSKKAAKKATKKTTKKNSKKVTQKTGSNSTKKSASKKTKQSSVSAAPAATETYQPQVQVGGVVPNFSLPQTGEKTFQLSDYKGKKVIIYFYPKDATPGCTIEGHDFTRLKPEFQAVGAEVFGVSRDSMSSHEKFKSKESYSIDLLSDEEEKLCAIFGVIKMKNMYGKQVRGIDRSTFLINENGQLIKEWRGVKVDGHAAEVLQAVKGESN